MTELKLADIEVYTREYANARQRVNAEAEALRADIDAAKRNRITNLKILVAAAIEKKHALENAITGNKSLFDKPKTQVFNGIKVGFRKQKGELSWEDVDKVVELIKKNFPDQTDTLLRVVTTPVKAALENLSVADLKSVAVKVGNDDDVIVLKPVDANVDKLVEALLKEDPEAKA